MSEVFEPGIAQADKGWAAKPWPLPGKKPPAQGMREQPPGQYVELPEAGYEVDAAGTFKDQP